MALNLYEIVKNVLFKQLVGKTA